MESKRQAKFARVIQKELGEIFQRDGSAMLPGILITITKVRVTSDLSLARTYISFFNSPDSNTSLNSIRSQSREIRYKLGTRIKDQVRAIPALEFYVDDTNEYSERIDKIFDQINLNSPTPAAPAEEEMDEE